MRQATENLPPAARTAAKAGATGAAVGVAVFAVPPLLGFTTAGVAAGTYLFTLSWLIQNISLVGMFSDWLSMPYYRLYSGSNPVGSVWRGSPRW